MRPRTKIVATLGPATDPPEVLAEVLRAGVDVVRLNLSHGDIDGHLRRLESVRRHEHQLDRFVGVLVDLPGPKVRAGDFGDQPVAFDTGDRVVIRFADAASGHDVIAVDPIAASDAIRVDDRVVIGDGAISLRVQRIGDQEIHTVVESPGSTQGRPGVHFATTERTLVAPTANDLELARRFASEDVDFMAVSYVRSASDVLDVRAVVGDRCALVAKIETGAAVDGIEQLIDVSDAIMVARGDLGIDLPLEDVPHLQKLIIDECVKRGRPVITATQMLESMIVAPTPTRAEVSDVANAVLDGTDAVMLSGETALGADPANVVRTLRRILIRADADAASVTRPIPTNAERHQVDRGAGRNPLDADVITNALTHAGARAAADLENASIICWTRSGRTARALARHRPSSRLFAVSASVATLRQCSLSWGLLPLQVDDTELTDELVRRAVARCLETGEVAVGDLVVIITGAPEHPSGAAADMLRIVPIR